MIPVSDVVADLLKAELMLRAYDFASRLDALGYHGIVISVNSLCKLESKDFRLQLEKLEPDKFRVLVLEILLHGRSEDDCQQLAADLILTASNVGLQVDGLSPN
jgi:hypothetical protein